MATEDMSAVASQAGFSCELQDYRSQNMCRSVLYQGGCFCGLKGWRSQVCASASHTTAAFPVDSRITVSREKERERGTIKKEREKERERERCGKGAGQN